MGSVILSALLAGWREIDARTAAAVILAILLPLGGYLWGHRDAAEACRAREIAAALAGAEHNIETLTAAAGDAAERSAKLEAVNGSLRAKVEGYERSIANPTASAAAVCRLTDDDARRLRELGATGSAAARRR